MRKIMRSAVQAGLAPNVALRRRKTAPHRAQ